MATQRPQPEEWPAPESLADVRTRRRVQRYADAGHPLMPRISNTLADLKDFFLKHWPSSAEIYLPGGNVPTARKLFRNPSLARTWRRLLEEAEGVGGDRDRQIEAARNAFYRGFVADAIDRFARTEVMDETGTPHRLAAAASSMPRADAPIWRIGIR